MGWSADIASADSMRCKMHDADYKHGIYSEIVGAVRERARVNTSPANDITTVRLDLYPELRKKLHEKITAIIRSM